MTRGGTRPRSGPEKDPNSARTDRARRQAEAKASAGEDAAAITTSSAAFNPMALPARGRGGNPPAFPLPKIDRFKMTPVGDGKMVKQADEGVGSAFRKRELEIWRQIWKTPQALAWEREAWRWSTIAKYCRISATTEAEPDASAALLSRERELRIEIGLTPDGLKINGWAIAPDELAERRSTKAATPAPKAKSSRDRMKVVGAGNDG